MNKTYRKQITKLAILATSILMATSSFASELKPLRDKNDTSKWGFIDSAGKQVVSAKYDGVGEFNGELAPVSKAGKWGFINTNGEEIVPITYSAVANFKEGYAPLLRGNKWGMIDTSGKEIISFIYNELYYFDKDGKANAKKDGKWGKIDKNGEIVVPFMYNNSEVETKAVKSNSKIVVDGEEVNIDSYNIKGTNYVKIRDIAMLLDDSEKQFEVGWNKEKRAIDLLTSERYTVIGGELEKINTKKVDLRFNKSSVNVDGEEVALESYNINNETYFKLRDISEEINIGLKWNQKEKSIQLDTTEDYTAE